MPFTAPQRGRAKDILRTVLQEASAEIRHGTKGTVREFIEIVVELAAEMLAEEKKRKGH